MMTKTTWLAIKAIRPKIQNGYELMDKFPQFRQEYLDEILEYNKILYELVKEAMLP